MSAEALELMCGLNRNELEVQVGLQCAPLLTGIKISNLLTVPDSMEKDVERLFQRTEISLYVFCRFEGKVTFFLYRKEPLENYLGQPETRRMMEDFGYRGSSLSVILKWVAAKYSVYMASRRDFPHEIGLLLGYPAEDVAGFVKNHGKNFLYTGYWKVYGDLKKSLETFEGYDQAKERVVRMISRGAGVHDIIQLHCPDFQDKIAI